MTDSKFYLLCAAVIAAPNMPQDMTNTVVLALSVCGVVAAALEFLRANK